MKNKETLLCSREEVKKLVEEMPENTVIKIMLGEDNGGK